MPSFLIKVPNDDDGESLGEYEADYLPRAGDEFTIYHPALTGDASTPFYGMVRKVAHEARCGARVKGEHDREMGAVDTTVWLVERSVERRLFCDCSPEEQLEHGEDDDGCCNFCGDERVN